MESVADYPGRPLVPARQVILSAAALWLCYLVLVTVRGLVVETGEFWDMLWRRGLVTLVGIAVTLLAWQVLRRFDERTLATRIIAALIIMLPASIALAVANKLAFEAIEKQYEAEAMKAEAQARKDCPLPQAATEIRIIHPDMSGNVLVDTGTLPRVVPAPPAPPAPAVAPAPPAPPRKARSAPSAPDEATPPVPDLPPMAVPFPSVVTRHFPDGSSETRAPGVVIRHNADGSTMVISRSPSKADGDDDGGDDSSADDASTDAEDAAAAASRADARAIARKARDEARIAMRNALRDSTLARMGLPVPAPVAPPAPPAPPAEAARPAPRATVAARPAPGPTATRAAPAVPAPRPKATAAPTAPAPTPSAATPPATPVASATPTPAPDLALAQMHDSDDEGLWRQLTDLALGRYFLLLAWAALYLALGMAEQARASERREGEYRRAAKAAELRSLRYQVNPHFLFNTLNSLSALVMVGRSEQAEKMIQTISSFYRHSLAGDPTSDVPLSDEIALQRHYLEIEAVRFPERLRTEFDIPAELENACVPGMILQPLVENSIKYAVSASRTPVTVRIAAREAGDLLVITVADDGPAQPADKAGNGTGIGVANVRSRLAASFGEAAHVESGPLPAGGYATVLTMPLVRAGC